MNTVQGEAGEKEREVVQQMMIEQQEGEEELIMRQEKMILRQKTGISRALQILRIRCGVGYFKGLGE